MLKYVLSLSVAFFVCSSQPVLAQDDAAADPQATWNLTDLFPTEEAWNKAREEVLAGYDEIDTHRGTLGDSAAGVKNYKELLRAGGSDYPYTLLVNAGVDLAQPEPYQSLVSKMNDIMDEMERLLDEQQ